MTKNNKTWEDSFYQEFPISKEEEMYIHRILTVAKRLEEVIDALQDEPEDKSLSDMADNLYSRGKTDGYSKGYQQAIKDAIAAVPSPLSATPRDDGQNFGFNKCRNIIVEVLKKLQEK